VNIVDQPPTLSSTTNPSPALLHQPHRVMAWTGGNPTVGYYQLFDRYPSSRPTPQTGTFEPTNKNPAQVLFQKVTPGRWWFHMLALDSMGTPPGARPTTRWTSARCPPPARSPGR